MRLSAKFCTFFSIILIANNLLAQNLEFIQNKGQWDSRVKYTGGMGAASFFLQQQGYKIILNNPTDLNTIADYFGGHKTGNKNSPSSKLLNNDDGGGAGGNGNTKDKLVLHSHAYDVIFLGSSEHAEIIPDKPLSNYNNYFIGNDPQKWATNCKIFSAITYKNIYPNIDARYYTNDGKLKYDLIVRPGGDINKIALQFNGVDGLSIKNGDLIVKTSVGDVSELSPISYQLSESGRTNITAKYVISGNVVHFQLGNYSKTSTIIIDPTLKFSSFVGSKADAWGYTATYDNSGNFYAGGIAFGFGYNIYPNPGAYQTIFAGGDGSEGTEPYDIGITKFNPTGSTIIYSTYLGGGGNEQPHSLVADEQGNLIISGRTTSESSFPTTAPLSGAGGGFDIFIAKLNASGTILMGSRLFGGKSADGVNIRPKYVSPGGADATRRNYGDDSRSEVILDANDNIYLASSTQSTDFPTSGGFQSSFGGGRQDGVLIKTNSDVSNILFSSFIGGGNDDAAFVLALNPLNNDIYVAGGTLSNNFPGKGVNNGPVLFGNYQGGLCDGFISIISNDGSKLRKTSYVGTAGNDLVYGVQFDKLGFPYVTGTTTTAFPVINSGFNSQGKGKQFITKLKPDLSGIVYSTNFGKGQSEPDISPTAFLVDRCENVYVSGWGGGINSGDGYPNATTSGLITTAGALRSNSDGQDFYFFVLKKDGASQLYGTFFGEDDSKSGGLGDHVDGGTSRFDKQGVIYEAICADCGATGGFPTQGNVAFPSNIAVTGSRCNLAAVKIAMEFAGVSAGLRSAINGVIRDSSGCVPLTVVFTDTVNNAKEYIWDYGDGSKRDTTFFPTISSSHTYNNVGVYRVMLIAIDSTTCNIADTAYINIHARNDKAIIGFTKVKLPPCDSLKYEFTNISVAPVGKPFNSQSFEWVFGDGTTLVSNAPVVTHSYAAAGTYRIVLRLIDTSYCNSPDSAEVTIRIAINVKAQFETPPFGCAPYLAFFNNTSLGGQQYFWDFGDGSPIDNNESPTHLYTNPGTYIIKLVVIDPSTCNITDSTLQTIIVSPKPTADFSFTPIPPQENTYTTFFNSSVGGTHYKWLFGDGDSLVTIQRDTIVKHIYNASGVFTVCLIAYNDYDCTDTICKPVQSIILPLLDVPNAFTPNSDGVNDFVRVRGFGITQMNWKIFNRWGTLVFQSTNPNAGWNGYYRGTLQPQEVYVYVLDVTFSDKSKYQKKGDITLLR